MADSVTKRCNTTGTGQIPIWSRKLDVKYYKFILYSAEESALNERNPNYVKTSGTYLDRDECSAAGKKLKKTLSGEAGQLDIKEYTYSITNDITMMKLVYLWLINRKLKDMKTKQTRMECTTAESLPGMIEHVDVTGCLTEWREFVEDSIDEATATITPFDISNLYIEVLNSLNANVPHTIGAISLCLKEYCTDELDELSFYADGGEWGFPFMESLFSRSLQQL